jgi:hypothetical protein
MDNKKISERVNCPKKEEEGKENQEFQSQKNLYPNKPFFGKNLEILFFRINPNEDN